MAFIAAGCTLYIMAAIPLCREQIFLERDAVTRGDELLILLGFLFVALFNILSIVWNALWNRQPRPLWRNNKVLPGLGVLCLVLLAGEKTMLDEIGREYALGWETLDEWIILYAFLSVQLLYTFLMLRTLKHAPKNPLTR